MLIVAQGPQRNPRKLLGVVEWRSSLLFFALLTACAIPAAASINCPTILRHKGSAAELESASIFAGRPENLVDLMPDLSNSEWDIALEQRRGESMYLVCRYQGIKDTVTLLVPPALTLCKVEGTKKGLAAWCKSPVRRTDKTN